MIDFGEDRLTVGRPHPMIDPTLRLKRLAEDSADPAVAVLLPDIVLSHAPPSARWHTSPDSARHPADFDFSFARRIGEITGLRLFNDESQREAIVSLGSYRLDGRRGEPGLRPQQLIEPADPLHGHVPARVEHCAITHHVVHDDQ